MKTRGKIFLKIIYIEEGTNEEGKILKIKNSKIIGTTKKEITNSLIEEQMKGKNFQIEWVEKEPTTIAFNKVYIQKGCKKAWIYVKGDKKND